MPIRVRMLGHDQHITYCIVFYNNVFYAYVSTDVIFWCCLCVIILLYSEIADFVSAVPNILLMVVSFSYATATVVTVLGV